MNQEDIQSLFVFKTVVRKTKDVELFGQENRKAEEWKRFIPLICASFGSYGNLEGGRSSGN